MSEFLDELQSGAVTRRAFVERIAAAGAGLSMISAAAMAQTASPPKSQKTTTGSDADNPKYSPANIGGGGRLERDFYRDWIRKSRVPMVEGYSIYDARDQEAQPWPQIGGKGLYLNFSGNVHMDGVILEIPEGKALVPRRNLYEQLLYVLKGRGHTTVGHGTNPQKFDWAEGSLFTVPLNVSHRHFNDDSAHPARILAVTTFPFMLQVFGSLGFINESKNEFADRFNAAENYYGNSKQTQKRWWKTNFVKDIRTTTVIPWEERGKGNESVFWEMGGNTILEPHVSEFPVATYKLGHRHPYEAIILTLNGKGFSLAGRKGLKETDDTVKIDWKAGSVVSPPYFWFHQHFNTGDTKARYWAITEGDFPKRLGIPLDVEQIEPAQEDPSIKRRFERELGHQMTGAILPNPGLHQHHHDHDDHDHHHHHA
ncbi:MAG TPA: cupin domain-containing protein [Thermoanaerobaculia bacterium]